MSLFSDLINILSRFQVQANWWPLLIIAGCLILYSVFYWFRTRNHPEIEGIENA